MEIIVFIMIKFRKRLNRIQKKLNRISIVNWMRCNFFFFLEVAIVTLIWIKLVLQPAVRGVARAGPAAFKQFSDRSSPAEHVDFQSFTYETRTCPVRAPCVLPADYLQFYDRRAPVAKNVHTHFLLRGTYGLKPVRVTYGWRAGDVRVTCGSRTVSTKFARRARTAGCKTSLRCI